MFNRKCKIVFIRPGSTIYTEQNRLYNHDDYPPISEKGKLEIEKISHWLKITNPKIDKIYTSTSLRAIQSTRIIAKSLKVDYELIDNLHERKSGIWGGLTFAQIEEKFPEMLAKYHKNPYGFWPEGGETTEQLNKRVNNILDKLVDENTCQRIILISHGGVIQSAVRKVLNIPPEDQAKVYIPTGSATQISYYEDWASLVYSGYMPL